MDKNRISHLLQKLRSHQASAGEKDELESFWKWAQTDQSAFNALADEEKESLKKEMFSELQNRIGEVESARNKQRFLHSPKWLLKVAASIAFLFMAVWIFYPDNRETVRTAYGEHLEMLLPDSSTVILNGNSVIRFDRSWSDDENREVWIEGEAFFDVQHLVNNRKFIVHTSDGVDVEVLGTRFNVKIRRGKTEVMLEEGKVRIDVERIFSEETLTLKPGELGLLTEDEISVDRVNPLKYSAWKDHRLYFDETTLLEVGHLLEDTYGMQVVFEDEALATRKLSGQIDARYAEDILLAIAESFNIDVSKDRAKVTFYLDSLGE